LKNDQAFFISTNFDEKGYERWALRSFDYAKDDKNYYDEISKKQLAISN
jgi:hypothetical protein